MRGFNFVPIPYLFSCMEIGLYTLTFQIYIFHSGQECKDPATIDAQVYATGTVNRHSPKTLDGFCNNIPKGEVTVGISVAECLGGSTGDAYTGWNSVSRIIIEEMVTL